MTRIVLIAIGLFAVVGGCTMVFLLGRKNQANVSEREIHEESLNKHTEITAVRQEEELFNETEAVRDDTLSSLGGRHIDFEQYMADAAKNIFEAAKDENDDNDSANIFEETQARAKMLLDDD